jgi:TonB-linked SusC/RagA family outer membrane protein
LVSTHEQSLATYLELNQKSIKAMNLIACQKALSRSEKKWDRHYLLMIMKKSFFLLLTPLLLLAVQMHAQGKGVSLSEKNAPLKKVLKEIRRQTGFTIFYEDQLLLKSKPVAIEVKDQPLEQVLKQVFDKQPLTYEIIGSKMIAVKDKPEPKQEAAQSLQAGVFALIIRGMVTEEDGKPLEGATVKVKGTERVAVTKADGTYQIEVPDAKAVLEFSYIGYAAAERPVTENRVVDIVLKKSETQLEELVIVGYGTRKKGDVTGAIVTVNEQRLREIPAGNVATALQGTSAGVDIQKSGGNNHPGSTPTIRIRGDRSLSGTNDPLIIVDGIPFSGSLNDIAAEDITSVQILKDASSTAIYGSRGSNGVILLNTRRGKNEKPRISFDTYTGVNKVMGQFKMMNAEQFTQFKKWTKLNRAETNSSGQLLYTGINDPQLFTDAFTDPEELANYKAGVNTNWQDLIYSTGIITNHQLGVSGGTEKTQYAMSAGYYNSQGIYEKQGMKRFNLKLSIDQKIGKYIKVGLNTINTYTILTGIDVNPMAQALQATPYAVPYAPDGTLKGFLGNSQNVYNPLADFVDNAIVDRRTKMATFTSAYLDIDFTHGLRYKLNAGFQVSPETTGKFYAKNTTKQLGIRNWATNVHTGGYDYTLENILTYDKTIASDHQVNVTGLFSMQEDLYERTTLTYNDVTADFLQYNRPDYASNLAGSGDAAKWAILSYMGRFNYAYKGKYLATFTVRSDGSSRLAPGKQWTTFPSAALAWNISKENFMQRAEVVSNLKLRASYGTVGSTTTSAYATKGELSLIRYDFGATNVSGYYPTNAPNFNLAWERTTSMNFGLDFGLLKNRITGSVEFYKQSTSDLLLDQALPATSGIPNKIRVNVGKTEGTGMEFTVSSQNLMGNGKGGLTWSTDLNVFFNRMKITELASGAQRDITNGWFVGEPSGVYFNYKREGIWQNTAKDIALAQSFGLPVTGSSSVIGTIKVANMVEDNKLDDKDRVILGKRQPTLEGGVTNRLGFKNFDLAIVSYFKAGGMMKSDMIDGWMNTFSGAYNNLDVNYWTPANNENYWPKPNGSLQNPNYKSTLSYMSASYLKIRTITLGYTVPALLLKKAGIYSARLYSSITNPFIFFSEYKDKFGGIDPETNGSVELNTPPLRSIIVGLNVSF